MRAKYKIQDVGTVDLPEYVLKEYVGMFLWWEMWITIDLLSDTLGLKRRCYNFHEATLLLKKHIEKTEVDEKLRSRKRDFFFEFEISEKGEVSLNQVKDEQS